MMMMSSFVRDRFTPGRGQERFMQAMAFSVNGVWEYFIVMSRDRWFF